MKYTTIKELQMLQSVNEQSINKCVDAINKGFANGVSEDTVEKALNQLEGIIRKSGNVKYFKRTGTAGNYKYYYSKEDYDTSMRAQAKLKEVKPGSDHAEALKNKIARIENEGRAAAEKKQSKALEAKKRKWENSEEYFDLKIDKKYLERQLADQETAIKEHKMQEEQVFVEAQEAGFDDPAGYQGYQDYKEQMDSLVEDRDSLKEQISEVDKKMNKFDSVEKSISDSLNILKGDQLAGGLADGKSVKDIAKKHGCSEEKIKKQLAMGVDIEKEHTDDRAKAAEIALDHLWESENYYTELAKMESKVEKSVDENLALLLDIDLEKAVPIGTVNKYGKVKTANGWEYQKRGQRANGGKVKPTESSNRKAYDELQRMGVTPTIEGEKDRNYYSDVDYKSILDKEKDKRARKDSGKNANRGVGGEDDKRRKMQFREVLADKEGRTLVDAIEEYIGDLKDQPTRKEHMEGLRLAVKDLEKKTGYKYDISEQEKAFSGMYNEYGVHRGYLSITKKGENSRKAPTGELLEKEMAGFLPARINTEEERDYINSLPVAESNKVPEFNPDKTTENYLLKDGKGNLYFVDTQGYDYPRYIKRIEMSEKIVKSVKESLAELYGEDIEKAVPIGTRNKHGKIKTAQGWVYEKKSGGGNAASLPAKEEKKANTDIYQTVGKIKLSMDKNNLRLRAMIDGKLTYIGGKNNDGYFKDTASAQAFIDSNKETLAGIKSMNKLIYAEFTNPKGTDKPKEGKSGGGVATASGKSESVESMKKKLAELNDKIKAEKDYHRKLLSDDSPSGRSTINPNKLNKLVSERNALKKQIEEKDGGVRGKAALIDTLKKDIASGKIKGQYEQKIDDKTTIRLTIMGESNKAGGGRKSISEGNLEISAVAVAARGQKMASVIDEKGVDLKNLPSMIENAEFPLYEKNNESQSSESTPSGPKLKTKTEKYSWGKLVTVTKGNNWTAVMHPEHQEGIAKLKEGESFKFKDEQGKNWKVTATDELGKFNLEGADSRTENYKGNFEMETKASVKEWMNEVMGPKELEEVVEGNIVNVDDVEMYQEAAKEIIEERKKAEKEGTVDPHGVVGKEILLGKNKRKIRIDSFDGHTYKVTDLSDYKNPLESFGAGILEYSGFKLIEKSETIEYTEKAEALAILNGTEEEFYKAVPIGTVNKYGKVKTANGWVYQKRGSKGAAPKAGGDKPSTAINPLGELNEIMAMLEEAAIEGRFGPGENDVDSLSRRLGKYVRANKISEKDFNRHAELYGEVDWKYSDFIKEPAKPAEPTKPKPEPKKEGGSGLTEAEQAQVKSAIKGILGGGIEMDFSVSRDGVGDAYIQTNDRGARTDHGGGDDGDGWMSNSQIEREAAPFKKKWQPRIDSVLEKLGSLGFSAKGAMDYGEKGHIGLQFWDIKSKAGTPAPTLGEDGEIKEVINDDLFITPARAKVAINAFKKQLGKAMPIAEMRVRKSTSSGDEKTLVDALLTNGAQITKVIEHKKSYESADKANYKDVKKSGMTLTWLPNAEGKKIRMGYSEGAEKGIARIKSWMKKGANPLPSQSQVKDAQDSMVETMKSKHKLDIRSWGGSEANGQKYYEQDNHISGSNGIDFGGSTQRPGTTMRISLDYMTGKAKLLYGKYTSNIDSSYKSNDTEVNFDVTANPKDVVDKLMRSAKWKGLRADIDKSANAWAKGYADYIRSGGSLD